MQFPDETLKAKYIQHMLGYVWKRRMSKLVVPSCPISKGKKKFITKGAKESSGNYAGEGEPKPDPLI